MKQANLIVGGGIAGLLSAILMKKKFPEIPTIVIEHNDECGGLLGSIKKENNWEFDYGSHILAQTGVKELDDILFEGVNFSEWHEMPLLKSGCYFNGTFQSKSHFPNLTFLSEEECHRATYEIMECASKEVKEPDNLEEHLKQTYGEFLTEKYYRPIMARQLGVDLDELHSFANCLFGYVRFIAGHAELSRSLKSIPQLDKVLAFTSYEEGVSSLMNYYPKNGVGIGKWVSDLIEQAERHGVEVLTSTSIKECKLNNKTIETVTLSDGRVLEIDKVIWTVPTFLFFKASGLEFESRYRPKLRRMSLFHYVIDRPFQVDPYHVYCNDPDLRSFRITLYPNIQNDAKPNGDYRCTVEVMVEEDEKSEEMVELIWNELVKMGIVSNETEIIAKFSEDVANGFPIMTNQFVSEVERQHEFIKSKVSNMILLGKGSSKSFFMNDVLKDVFFTLNELSCDLQQSAE